MQDVGFRPAVHRVARAAGLGGFVCNDADGVWIEIEGAYGALAGFLTALRREAPPLSRIDAIEIAPVAPMGERDFHVVATLAGGACTRISASIPADAATCDACLRELRDPTNRRYRYPFINCNDCGPRFTINRDLPCDRARTATNVFAMCALCRAEYGDPTNRRFHAEPNACPACGPHVWLVDHRARHLEGEVAIAHATELLALGSIVALKGLGGYQLAVRADLEGAVSRLRALKRRPHKPFAVMARDVAAAGRLVALTDATRAALLSPARPIVRRAAKRGIDVAPSVAPFVGELGVMLPATPLHHLLLADLRALVMTSGNMADEPIAMPIAMDDSAAFTKLGDVADAVLMHDQVIP